MAMMNEMEYRTIGSALEMCIRDRYRTVKVNFYHTPVEDNGYQYGHDFHAQAHKACFHDK